MTELKDLMGRLEEPSRISEVDATSTSSRAFIDGHLEKARISYGMAKRITDLPEPAIGLMYQVVLSVALAELRRCGRAVEPYAGNVDRDVVRAACVAASLDDAECSRLERLLDVYGRSFDAGALPSPQEVEFGLDVSGAALKRLEDVLEGDSLRFVRCDPDVLGGSAVFVGTRLPIELGVERCDSGEPWEGIVADYPSLTTRHIEVAREWLRRDGRPPRGRVLGVFPEASVVSRRLFGPPRKDEDSEGA